MEKTNKPVIDPIESTRRGFLQWGTGILTFLCGLAVGIPLVGSFIGPAFRTMKTNWIKVVKVGALPTGTPISLSAADVQVDAYVHESMIRHLWAIKNSDTEITVFSPICPHLGCHYNWNPTSGHFECPCHGSVYAPD